MQISYMCSLYQRAPKPGTVVKLNVEYINNARSAVYLVNKPPHAPSPATPYSSSFSHTVSGEYRVSISSSSSSSSAVAEWGKRFSSRWSGQQPVF